MSCNVGLWIDRKQAYIIWNETGRLEVVQSDLEPRTHHSGGTRIGGTYNQRVDSELRYNDRFRHQLNEYYTRVISTIRDADSIFVMGPGKAKTEFEKLMQKHKGLHKKLQGMEATDKMTKNQMVARVRKFFAVKA